MTDHPTSQDEQLPPTFTPFLTTWCGGSEGNAKCNFNCKLCLIFSGKAELIKADDKCLTLTYRIREGA